MLHMGLFERFSGREQPPKSREEIKIELERELKGLNEWEAQVPGFAARDNPPSSRYEDEQVLKGIAEKKKAIERKLEELDPTGEN